MAQCCERRNAVSGEMADWLQWLQLLRARLMLCVGSPML